MRRRLARRRDRRVASQSRRTKRHDTRTTRRATLRDGRGGSSFHRLARLYLNFYSTHAIEIQF